MPTKTDIGQRLRKLREELRISREKAAIDLNISASALRMYESGERTPRDEVKIRLADYYNQSVQAIFFDPA
ncbi:MAG: helix-turn-helix transcriptional regulator [Clostridia bacterium]|nr:helix-turn-helix transcriptional regulator [Clostridia bacterium]